MTPTFRDPADSLTRLHAALVTVGDGLVRGSASDLLAAETELSSLVRDLPALVEAARLSHDSAAFGPLLVATRKALARARGLGRNVELSFRESEEASGRLASYGPSGIDAHIAPLGALDTRA